ncbi:unnamed protein product [Aureobasidium mustum]|uniref:F-box domain-containing protein n=1 Tax=Aureobasidium mustum TaxID=2773714 RepID=A0A9N8PM00_9PEZI|nr:unnamed protein product [Aureobasidium mustum]
MAAAQVLGSPELLSLILQCFEEQHDEGDELERRENRLNRSTLATAARVDNIWFETATRVLWSFERGCPELEILDNIEPVRREIYASKLTSILIKDKSGQTPSILALSFPRRRTLCVGLVGKETGPSVLPIKQYLCPSIDFIDFWEWDEGFDKDLLTTIKFQCPRLRFLVLETVDTHNTDITPEDFNDFFCTKSLEFLRMSIESPLMSKSLFSTLGRMQTLRNLSITSYLSLRQIPEYIFSEGTSFFDNLEQVDLILEREAVQSAIVAIRHASTVKLRIKSHVSARMAMFSDIKRMENLEDLTLVFEGEDTTYVEGEDLCQLGALKKLEFLVLRPADSEIDIVRLLHFNDLDFQAMFAGLRRLHTLSWELTGLDLSVKTLIKLARNARFRNIFFRGSWDLQGLSKYTGRLLFPNLRNLQLERTVISGHKGNIPFKRIAENLLRHAPRLSNLTFDHDQNAKVHDTWKKLKKEKADWEAKNPPTIIYPPTDWTLILRKPSRVETLKRREELGALPQAPQDA